MADLSSIQLEREFTVPSGGDAPVVVQKSITNGGQSYTLTQFGGCKAIIITAIGLQHSAWSPLDYGSAGFAYTTPTLSLTNASMPSMREFSQPFYQSNTSGGVDLTFRFATIAYPDSGVASFGDSITLRYSIPTAKLYSFSKDTTINAYSTSFSGTIRMMGFHDITLNR